MRNAIVFAAALLLLSVQVAEAQRLQGRFVTSAYVWGRNDTVGVTSSHLFGYQSAHLTLAQENLSLQTHFQAFNDFAGPVKNHFKFRLYNLSFHWRNIGGMGDVSLGRQYVFAGVGTGGLDGAKVLLRFLDSRVQVVGYGGLLIAPRHEVALIDDGADNRMFGGQVRVEPHEMVRVSLSYLNRTQKAEAYVARRLDSLFNEYSVEIRPSADAEEYLGGDIDVTYGTRVSVYGRYEHDLQFDEMSRGEVFARVSVLENLALTGEYLRRQPRLRFNSIFSAFVYNTLEEVEGGVEYGFLPGWNAVLRFGSVSYGDASTQRVTIGAQGQYVGVQLVHTTGDDRQISGFSLNAGYPFMDRKLTPTITLSYAQYKLSAEEADLTGALAAGLGAVYRPSPSLSIDSQIQVMSNKIYASDVRWLLRVNYLLNERLNIF